MCPKACCLNKLEVREETTRKIPNTKSILTQFLVPLLRTNTYLGI